MGSLIQKRTRQADTRSTRSRVPRTTSRRQWDVIQRPRLLGAVIFLILATAAAIGARSAVDGSGPTVPASVPFRYTIVTGDTVACVSSLLAADSVSLESQTGGTLVAGTIVKIDAGRLWHRMSSDPFGGNEILVVQGARRFGIRPALALAVAWQESRLQQDARSPTGAIGIMQVEPDTSKLVAKDLGVAIDPTTATDNITAGLFWLHALLTTYHDDEASALAAYYEGPGNLARRGYLDGTAEYVAHVRQVENAVLAANPALDA